MTTDTYRIRRAGGARRAGLLAAMVAASVVAAACSAPGAAPHPATPTSSETGSMPSPSNQTLPDATGRAGGPTPADSRRVGGPPSTMLRRGQQGTAADLPWGQVGRNWFLALWRPGGPGADGPVSLFVVDPLGGRYLVHRWPTPAPPVGIDDWSGDGRRVLLSGAQLSVMDLATGAVRVVTGSDNVTAAEFTRPSGTGVVMVRPWMDGETVLGGDLVRVDPSGGSLVDLSAGTSVWVSAADGRSLIVNGQGELRVIDNSGRTVKAIPTPVVQSCRPVRGWPDGRALVACGTDLWLLSPSSSGWSRLTAPPQLAPVQTFGNRDAYPLGGAVYTQADAPCGPGYVARVGADGSTTPVSRSGSLDGPAILVGTDGASRLAVLTSHSCEQESDTSLAWYDPITRQADVLLGPAVGGGQVQQALEFPETVLRVAPGT